MLQPPTIDDIRAAAQRIQGAVIRTPMLVSRTLSEIIGAEVWLKFENLQFTAAYKERGALNKLLQLSPEERARGVIAASAGNHAQAVAYHAKRLGIPATIVMPLATPTIKVTQTEGHGARVVLHGALFDDAFAKARELEQECGYVFVHPFDDPQIIAGAGTVGLEMLEDAPELDMIVVPIGGGGLMSGISTAARALKPDIELIGVEAELYPGMKCAIDGAHRPVGGDTLAEGIAVKQPGVLTSQILKALADDIVLVAERDLERAVAMLVGIEKTVVEGAGAAGLAAMIGDPARFAGKNSRDGAVRRQHRHAFARQRPRPRPGPAGPNRQASGRGPGPAGRAGADHAARCSRPARTSSRSTTAGSSRLCPPRTR